VVGGTVLLCLVAAVGARRVVVDNHLSALLPADDPVRMASARIDQALGGTLALEVELSADGPWLTAPRLAPLEAFERWAAAQPEVRVVSGPATLRNLLPAATDPDASPDALALRRALLDDGPRAPPGVRPEQAGEPTHRARVSIQTADLGGRAFAALAERVRTRAAELPGHVLVTGTPLLAYRGVDRIAHELLRSLLSVVVVITLAIAVLLRSAWLSLLALVPNVLPPALAYGALGLLGIELDPLAAVILCVALGLAVDDSLHLLARLREGQAAGLPLHDALEQAVTHSGHAALVTSVALCGGLSLDLLSSFPPLRLLGGLGAATLALAWIFDVVMLPGLLRAATRRRDDAPR
jgi:predicted RND superfamily exporter protein